MSQQQSGKAEFYPSRGGGTTILSGILAARPIAGVANRYYWATDVFVLFRDTGAAWEKIGGMLYALYLYNVFNGLLVAAAGYPVNMIDLVPIQITETITIDRLISYCNLNNDGNVRMALYYDNGFVPDGGALIVETASVAVINGKNELAIANTRLTPGLYWLAQNRDSGISRWVQYELAVATAGTVQGRNCAFGYGAFPAVCPVTAAWGGGICQGVRIATIP